MSAETALLSPLEVTHWKQIFALQFGVTGDLVRLNGEYDTNIGIYDQGKIIAVAKIAAPDCLPAHIDMQIAALAHIAKTAPDVPVPRVIPTSDGQSYDQTTDINGHERLIWIMTSLQGKPLADIRPHNELLLDDIGYMCGRVTAALADFTHPELSREIIPDV